MELKILIVASEMSPYAKSGGLGDVIGSLPHALNKNGVDVRVVIPKYKTMDSKYSKNLEYIDSFVIPLSWRNQSASILSLKDSEVPIYFIENDYYFGRDGLYGYGDDYERFCFFTKAAIESLNYIEFLPDVIHFHDWQTALGPIYLRDIYGKLLFFQNIKSLFTIHNLQYQGVFGRGVLSSIDLNDGYFNNDKLEFHNNICFMKGAIVYSDGVSTVSKTYSDEIQTPQYGYSMDGILRKYNYKLSGILNGIDNSFNDPETDPHIFKNFSKDSLHLKKENKISLQKQLNLPVKDVPIISIISRLVDQKGLDLISVAMDEILSKDIQLVILGTGDSRYEHLFKNAEWRAPEKVSANIFFNDDLAKKIYASSDIFLMPSLFEPCGLGQIFAMRYGTIPVVRHTGGLVDTVSHFDFETKKGNGFSFNDYVASGMMWAVNLALDTYKTDDWNKLIINAMESDFSWDKSSVKYIELYNDLKNISYK